MLTTRANVRPRRCKTIPAQSFVKGFSKSLVRPTRATIPFLVLDYVSAIRSRKVVLAELSKQNEVLTGPWLEVWIARRDSRAALPQRAH